MDTIHELFELHAQKMPNGVAAVSDNHFITYRELNKKANQLANFLREKGVLPDNPVAICLERSLDLLITILAILKAGGAYVPLDPSHPPDRLFYILQDINSPLLITSSSFKKMFSSYHGERVVLDNGKHNFNSQRDENLTPLSGKDNLAYIIYTSGSTGNPKGVLIEHKGVVNYCHWFSGYCPTQPQQRVDFSSNYIFDMAVTTSIVPLMLGLTVVVCNDKVKKNFERYLAYLQSNKINLIKMTPSYLKALVQEAKTSDISLPHLHALILGGENLHTADCKVWLELFPRHTIYNEYGPTESTVGVAVYKVNRSNISQLDVNVPIGLIDRNLSFYLLDNNQKRVNKGEVGELYVGGICLARGYLNQSPLENAKFIKNPFKRDSSARLYKTGDLCRELTNGVLEYLGRIDQQVKINGFRIQLEEIEQSLISHPDIKDVIVLVKENLLQEKQLVAYYIPVHNKVSSSVSDFRHYLHNRLPHYMIPAAFVWVDSFPRTANDKLDIAALPVPQFLSAQHYVTPCTKLERELAKIWSAALGINPIGSQDNFFELGGHSLAAARIISAIEKSFKKEVALEDFYQAPTISMLATIIRKAKRINIKNTRRKNTAMIPLNDFQFMFWIANILEPKIKKLNIVGKKRFKGKIDVIILYAAFESVFKKQEIFFYRTNKLSPAQKLHKKDPFKIQERNLELLSIEASESRLLDSFYELIDYGPWPKSQRSIVARLFYLPSKQIELQISMPHIISDYGSIDILFNDLSKFYLLHKSQTDTHDFIEQKQFKNFLSYEQYDLNTNLEKNLAFWQSYLRDADFFSFRSSHVIKNMETKKYSYSTYKEIPEEAVSKLQHFCAEKHVSITDGLCAVLALALSHISNPARHKSKKIFMSIVKSVRDNPLYQDKVGCFLRLDGIKIDIGGKPTLVSLCEQAHQSSLETLPYQQCSGMAKSAAVGSLQWKGMGITEFFLNKGIYLYTKLFRSLKLNHKLFSFYLRLTAFLRNKQFFIYINLLTNFLPSEQKKETQLFGLKNIPSSFNKYDLSKINSVMEVYFLRDENLNKPYVVVSANLKPAIRELIAQEMVQIIQNETVSANQSADVVV